MALNYGQTATVGIKFLNSYNGVASPATGVFFMEIMSESVNHKIPPLYSEGMRGIFDEGDSYAGPYSVEGDVELEAEPIALGTLLAATMGAPTTTAVTSAYSHKFEPRTADWDTVSANYPIAYFKNLDQDTIEKYHTVNAHGLELSIEAGSFLKAKCSFVGGSFGVESVGTTSGGWTPVYPTGKKFTWDQTSVSIAGTARPELMSFTVKVEDGMEAIHTLSAKNGPSRITRQAFRNVQVEATMKFDDRDEYQEFIDQSEREMVVSLVGKDDIGGTGVKNSLEIAIPKMRYEEYDQSASGAGQIEVSMKGRGKYSVDSGTALSITLVNTQDAWY